jgi:hypothetical protein
MFTLHSHVFKYFYPLSFNVIASDVSSVHGGSTYNHLWKGLIDSNYSFDDGSVLTYESHNYNLLNFMLAWGDSGFDKYNLPHIYGEAP